MPVRVDGRAVAAVFAGGAIGGLLRSALADSYPHGAGTWPWVTFAVNIAGAFVVGYVATLPVVTSRMAYQRPLLATGFCGGLTTFSTLQLELLDMIDAHNLALAVAYSAGSIACGYLAVLAGSALASRSGALA